MTDEEFERKLEEEIRFREEYLDSVRRRGIYVVTSQFNTLQEYRKC